MIYFTCLSCTLLSIAPVLNPSHVKCDRLIQQTLDIVRDIPVEPGNAELTSVFRSSKNTIGVEIALPDRSGFTVAPPPALPPEQVGFADVVLDADGYQRHSLLGAHNPQQEYRFSFTLQLAKRYLETKGVKLFNPKTHDSHRPLDSSSGINSTTEVSTEAT